MADHCLKAEQEYQQGNRQDHSGQISAGADEFRDGIEQLFNNQNLHWH